MGECIITRSSPIYFSSINQSGPSSNSYKINLARFGDVIVHWGTAHTSSAGTVTVTLLQEYSSTGYSVGGSYTNTSQSNKDDSQCSIANQQKGKFTIRTNEGGYYSFMAIGY